MSIEEKIVLLEETFDMSKESLSPEMNLNEIDEYDSMAKLSLMVMMEDEFDVKLDSATIKGFSKVQDILNLMNK